MVKQILNWVDGVKLLSHMGIILIRLCWINDAVCVLHMREHMENHEFVVPCVSVVEFSDVGLIKYSNQLLLEVVFDVVIFVPGVNYFGMLVENLEDYGTCGTSGY